MRNSAKQTGISLVMIVLVASSYLMMPLLAGAQAVQPVGSNPPDLNTVIQTLPTPLQTVLRDLFQLGQQASQRIFGSQFNPSNPTPFVQGVNTSISQLTNPIVKLFVFLGNFAVAILGAIIGIIQNLLARA
jgi:hypothetical protein